MKIKFEGEIEAIPSSSSYTLKGILLLVGPTSPQEYRSRDGSRVLSDLRPIPQDESGKPLFVPVEAVPPLVKTTKPRVRAVRSSPTGFDKWYELYPRKVARQDAECAFKVWLRNFGRLEDLMTATSNYATICATNQTEQKFIMHPSTFLRKERWRDYIVSYQARSMSQEEIKAIKDKFESGEYTESIVRKIEAKYGVKII